MNTFGIVPVNELSEAKTRLSKMFMKEERSKLVLCMLEDVLDALEVLDNVVIISPTDIKKDLNRNFDFILEEGKKGLDNAVKKANYYCIEKGAEATLFVPADLPLIEERHVKHILNLGRKKHLIISKSKDGGTGILFRKPPNIIDSKFTSQSFQDHKKEAEGKKVELYVYDSFPLSLDIDTPEDIEEFILYGKGTKTYDFLKELKF